jgi:SAM-dependent methyltransferase
MNRSRGLIGVNSYTKDLKFDVLDWLVDRQNAKGSAVWYDVCCGEARALFQAAEELDRRHLRDVKLIGADLIQTSRQTHDLITLIEGDVSTLTPAPEIDLITCVHGLHYIGDKLGLLSHLSGLLAPGGLFVGNIDPVNIRIGGQPAKGWGTIARLADAGKSRFVYKDHILKILDAGRIEFDVQYQAATISEGPNYTGITVMDSWYVRK